MLNELYLASKALAAQIQVPPTHKDVKESGNHPWLLVELDEEGKPGVIRRLEFDDTTVPWKHARGGHGAFPAFTVKKPLLDNGESSKRDLGQWKKWDMEKKRDLVKGLSCRNINPGDTKLLVSEKTMAALRPVLDRPGLGALNMLIARFPQNTEDTKRLVESLAARLQKEAAMTSDEKLLDIFADILLGRQSGSGYTATSHLYFDISETSSVEALVRSPKTRQQLIEALHSLESPDKVVSCALTGATGKSVGKVFASPRVNGLGNTPIYSKKKETPCLRRYTMTGSDAFPVSAQAATEASNALSFLTDATRKGSTWAKTHSSRPPAGKGSAGLAIVYLEDTPENTGLLASYLGDNNEAIEAYEAICRKVLGSADDVRRRNPDYRVRAIVLEAVDIAKKRVAYTSSVTVDRYCECVEMWLLASENHPKIEFSGRKKGSEFTPRPDSSARICNLLRKSYGRSKKLWEGKTCPLSTSDIVRLYIPPSPPDLEWTRLITRTMQIVLSKFRWLLADAGQLRTSGDVVRTLGKESVQIACRVVSLLSVLLFHMNIRKDDYVVDPSFGVGQALQLADILHREYAIAVVNKGDESKRLPPELIGNQMLSVALEDTNEAWSRLVARLRPYIAWAKTSGTPIARWTLGRYGPLCARLSESELPSSLDYPQQALVALGYLAKIEKKGAEVENE